MKKAKITGLVVRGQVQGVGFRPFIYHLATEMGIKGEVDNRTDGVYIRACFPSGRKAVFIERIWKEHPPVAFIHQIMESEEPEEDTVFTDFRILPSRSDSDRVTQVSPDIAVCSDCLRDRELQASRIRYPFVNCTHCGPRFSIIRDLPYDRQQTTMSVFPMCPACRTEYEDVADRRFHAQPIACNHCGPSYYATYKGQRYADYSFLLKLTARLIAGGEVIAVKGIGGYHLVCDALNERAVQRLREIKQRDSKPFAVMFRDMKAVHGYAEVNAAEEDCLTSWRRPIVLLKQKLQQPSLPAALNPGMRTLGCMLPYMPVHYDWFDCLQTPVLVMTSGNLSEVPILITPEEAERQLQSEVSLILHHNRDIHNRVDDSVVQVCGTQPCLVRRSRGYVPEPFFADMPVEGILAFGAEKVNTFALGKGDTVLQSQYIGDLKNWETYAFYCESLNRFRHLFRFIPDYLVCDLHSDYLSSREAARLAQEEQLPLLKVQHHHAHAVACMLEHGLHEPVIAVVMDGTGLGDDGTVWGGEFFLCDRMEYTRLSYFEPVPLPGGDKASVEPWRMAVAYLWHYGLPVPAAFEERIGKEKIGMLQKMMEKKVNTPYTSSAGRLFDAVASLLGVCDVATRQAEAPILLEQTIMDARQILYPVDGKGGETVSFRSVLESVIKDKADGVSVGVISARFHLTLAAVIRQKAEQLLNLTGARKVVISGGCFQNKFLTETLQRMFADVDIPLYIPSRIPCNDSGVAAGQLTVAAAKRLNNP